MNISEMPNEEINLLEYWNVLWRRKTMLISLFTVVVSVTMVISLLLPKYYKSETVIMAASSDAGGLGNMLSAIPLAGMLTGAAGIQTPADKIMVILKSRTIAETVIKRFNLLQVFNADDWDPGRGAWKTPDDPPLMQDAVKYLSNNVVDFTKNKEGAIFIAVEWKDPKLAAEIANFYVAALTEFMNNKSINMTVQVVDRAIPAERKSRPKIRLNMALAGVMSLFVGTFLAFFLEYLAKQKTQRA